MCRVFGCVAAEPVSVRHELLEAANPMIRQSEEHDSGWGMAVYERADGAEPRVVRFPQAAHADGDFIGATDMRGRIFNVHVRRATMGGLTPENTHPFCLGNYSFGHNGTILEFMRLRERRRPAARRRHRLRAHVQPAHARLRPRRRRRRRCGGRSATVVERSPFSGVNFLFSDGERLYAYRLGIFELHWLPRPGQLLVASERLTDEPWHTVQQDVLLTLDPEDLEEPHAERLLGDELVARADIRKFEEGAELRGAERGTFAAERAERIAAAARE